MRLLEVCAEGPGKFQTLLRVERLLRWLFRSMTQQGRLEPEEGLGRIERGIRAEDEPRPGAGKAFPGVGACGPPAPVAAGHGAVGQKMDRLHRGENPEPTESLPILGPRELDVLHARRQREPL